MGVIGTIVVIFVILLLVSVFGQIENDNELENKKKKDDLELQKKQKECELELQKKKEEHELELKRRAGLDPLYQEQMRKNKQYKAMIACLIVFIVLIAGYLIVSKSDSTTQVDYSASSKNLEIIAPLQEKSSIGQDNQKLPERFIPVVVNESQAESKSRATQPTVESRESVELAVENPFEWNTSNTMKSDRISVYDAGSHVGENTTVCGEVSQISQTAKATYINFGGTYPKHKFSGVMWSNNITPTLEGSNICITGLIESYKGTPQIVINSISNQISNH